MADDRLATYRRKRDFTKTPEPAGARIEQDSGFRYVIHKHWARQLHYDLRLELDGSMKSWAVPKGPSLDPSDKRMAVQVEDHPIEYNAFEGQIPAGQYGAGRVIIWDSGTWTPQGDARRAYRDGKLKFTLSGHKLRGQWALIRMAGRHSEKQPPWLLIKEHDEFERPAPYRIVDDMPDSVAELPAAAPTSMRTAPRASPSAKRTDRSTSTAKASNTNGRAQGRKSALPATLSPQLATLVEAVPQNAEDWQFELKFDGYRMLARIDASSAKANGKGKGSTDDGDDSVRLFTRNGHDWTDRMPVLAQALAQLPLRNGWLDGEVICLDARGRPDFQALQNAFDGSDTVDLIYYLFDLPFADGRDLRALPLRERREALQALLSAGTNGSNGSHGSRASKAAASSGSTRSAKAAALSDRLRFSEAFDAPAAKLIASACQLGFEGVIGKRLDAAYASTRNRDWIKLKCGYRQEFVIGGFTEPRGARKGIGALLLGIHRQRRLHYAGKVGTGFSESTLAQLAQQLGKLERADNPFAESVRIDGKVHWVEPELLAEVAFAEWTRDQRIRHAVFHGLRSDKPAAQIERESSSIAPSDAEAPGRRIARPASVRRATSVAARDDGAPIDAALGGLRVSHPDRIVDARSGATKIDVVRYYAKVAPLLLEHLTGRPVSLVRAPDGVEGQQFFQRHLDAMKIRGVRALPPSLWPGHPSLLEIASTEGLLQAAQMNVLELHTWNGDKKRMDRPDRISFDLDPGEGVSWAQMQEAAELLHTLLTELGLPGFLKTSGGKGLHVVVPIKRLHDWDTVKGLSKAIVQHLADTIPQRFVVKSGPRNRVGKIFVDYLRNGQGATTVAAWSVRARPGLGISVPIRWTELADVGSGAHWTIQNVDQRLSIGNGPWQDYPKAAVSIAAALRKLD